MNLPQIKQVPAAPGNYTPALSRDIEFIVIHVMAGSLTGTDAWFQNSASKVSAHYGVGSSGAIHQYVQENDMAWHAGLPFPYHWNIPSKTVCPGQNPNRASIGIEHEGQPYQEWPTAQLHASAALIADICHRHKIPADAKHIVRHSDITNLHNCPGPNCPVDGLIKMAADIVATLEPPAKADVQPPAGENAPQ